MNFAKTAKEYLTTEEFLTTGCPKIDEILRGGISKKGITQIYGEAGTGKTQFALQLCLTGQISENHSKKGVLYICTESTFPFKRLEQLLSASPIARKYKSSNDLLFVEHVSTVGDLEECLLHRVPPFLSTKSIALLIIDSIAAPYRVEYEDTQLKNRARSLRAIGQALHSFSVDHNVCIVCINQVAASMGAVSNLCHASHPVLGVTWACQVTNSINFCRVNGERHIHVRESPYVPRATVVFDIKQSGVFGSAIL